MLASSRPVIQRVIPSAIRAILSRGRYYCKVIGHLRGRVTRHCPICGYEGKFRAFGFPPRYDSLCGKCGSLERHRLLVLCDRRLGLFGPHHEVLHFAPEESLSRFLRSRVRTYRTADIRADGADLQLDIENIQMPDQSVDMVVASHVLEHVDDGRALSQIFRILRPGGRLIAMVPLIEGWSRTYENRAITDPGDRELHFGQHDHVRFYGRDFIERLQKAGFEADEFQADPPDCIAYGLGFGEKVFIARKPVGSKA